MNCQDHLYRGKSPQEISRRWFFQKRSAPAQLSCPVPGGLLNLDEAITKE